MQVEKCLLQMSFVPSSSTILDFRSYYVLQDGGWCLYPSARRRLETSTIASALGTHVDHLHVFFAGAYPGGAERRLHTFTNRERRSADGYKYVA